MMRSDHKMMTLVWRHTKNILQCQRHFGCLGDEYVL